MEREDPASVLSIARSETANDSSKDKFTDWEGDKSP